MDDLADLGVIGGSGFYSFLDDPRTVSVDTPFGAPSDDLQIGTVAGRQVAFLARHGQGHRYPPHRINYRANLWALRSVGVRQVLAPCAVGSLRPELTPGTIVVPDQVVDRTSGRPHTVYDEPGPVVHVGFADPYCPRGRAAVLGTPSPQLQVVDRGTLVVINGPRFSSRAESQWHQAAGWAVVGMTGMPEASIARELAMCLTTMCVVTDHDAGVEGEAGVTHAEVMRTFGRSIDALKSWLGEVIGAMPPPQDDATADCSCRRALDGLQLPFALP
ncbi:S-methyl-5'-thioadenosine phosphorylase [Calidifontibacter sp. DB0510]|uniref:Purine nucleoside phosphorylase n=1 Tax=Metallococcus carri TaxID=1656884 RepID=A0A967EEG1_9MICO|nr:S-methyl-5'-thioadenosine phosphorylase [Metallococcus carri]NHN55636.1 S-methyl-5'-thioadenosine phosphorylase [Metallococcus carri]NOP38180.1 S-methyl-5'-thioadenosine phosphorylase [Calidifontibacter sp. DB2511S]